MSIEPLESRIAPAVTVLNSTTATFTDVDGDLVVIKFSKPIAQQVLYSTTFGAPSITGAEQLLKIDLVNVTPAAAAGVNIVFAAAPKDRNADGIKDGDGHVNVGEIRAAGRDLGSVTIPGDLGRIVVGSGVVGARLPIALASLSVGSMGEYGLTTGAVDLRSSFSGDAGKIAVSGSIRDAYLPIGADGGTNPGKLGSLSVGGSIIGESNINGGTVFAQSIGSVAVRGDLIGGNSTAAGRIVALGKIASLTIGGSVLGGTADRTGAIEAGELGVVKIGRDVIGGTSSSDLEDTGLIRVSGNLASLSIGGSLIGGTERDSGSIDVTGHAGSIRIAGSIMGGTGFSLANSGQVAVGGKLTSIVVGGSLVGDRSDYSGSILAGTLTTAAIRGDVRGGFGEHSGVVEATSIGAITVGGSLIGGFDSNLLDTTEEGQQSGMISSNGAVGQLTIGGSIAGGSGWLSGTVTAGGTLESAIVGGDIRGGTGAGTGSLSMNRLGTLRVGGSLIGGFDPNPNDATLLGGNSGVINSSGAIGLLSIAGDVQGGSGNFSARIFGGAVNSIQIGGSLLGGPGEASGAIFTLGKVATLQIAGDVLGARASDNSGKITTQGGLGKVTIGGSVIGGLSASGSGFIDAGETAIDSLIIGGDLRGGVAYLDTENSGAVNATKIGAVTIGGGIYAGTVFNNSSVARLGAITSGTSIGSLIVKGDLIGNEKLPVVITAGGDPGIAPSVARPEPGIGSITVGGNVDHTFIAAGYTRDLIGISADVQIGAVRVGGDWIASYLTAGAKPGVDGLFGTADDRPLFGGENFGAGPVRDNLAVSKIASIVIGGQIKNGLFPAFPADGNQTYAFVAQQIGSFSYGGIVVPLTAGASNDTFALSKARPLGASRSSLNTDGFAMHVFEV